MWLPRFLILASASIFGQSAMASHYLLEMTDYANVGSVSGLRIGGLCGNEVVFPADACVPAPYDVAGLSLQVVSSSDEKLSIQSFGIDVPSATQSFDRYVTFRNTGNAGPIPDDVLRVRWLPATFSLSIDLISGSMVADYISTELGQATEVDQLVASPSEVVFGQTAWFGDWRKLGPAFNPVLFAIVPNATVPEPSVLALALTALGLGGAAARKRRRTSEKDVPLDDRRILGSVRHPSLR